MRLSDRDIHAKIEECELIVTAPRKDLPFDRYTQVQACSIDLRLDKYFYRFKEDVKQFDIKDLENIWDFYEMFSIDDGQPIVLYPNTILNGQIYEQLRIPPDTSGKIVGRSRFARLGLAVHSTGDFINPQFEGAMPLQLINHNNIPIVIYPYISICQLLLVKLSSEPLVPYPVRSDNPYHKERVAGPSVLHRDPIISGCSKETTIGEEFERRLVNNYLKKIERSKLMSEMKKEQESASQNRMFQGSGGSIVISNSNIGVLNPGQMIGNAKSTINQIGDFENGSKIREALTQIADFIEKNSGQFSQSQYQEVVELLGEIAAQASKPKEQRVGSSIVKTLVARMKEIIQIVATGSSLWEKWGTTIKDFFGF